MNSFYPLHAPVSNQTTVENLTELLQDGATLHVRETLHGMHAAEIADLLEALPIPQRHVVWELTDSRQEGEVLVHASDEVRANLIEMTNDQDLVLATAGLDIDDLADLIRDLPGAVTERALAGMDRQDRGRLEQVLAYDEDTAGGLMNTDVVTVRGNVTLDVVLRYLRMRRDIPEQTDKLIVVDYSNRYLGVLPLGKLVTKEPQTRVANVMETDTKPVPVSMPAAEVATLFENRDLVSAAVVDEDGKLLGRITVDDVVDVIRDEAHKEGKGFTGMSGEEDLFAPVFASAKKRAVWLGVNLATAFLAAWFLSLFQDTLEKVIVLAILVPIVASMGGIAGSQTLIIVIRGLATGHIVGGNSPPLLARELLVGLLNGLFWAAVVALLTVFWFDDLKIGGIIGVAMVANLLCAALAGVSIPILLKKLGIDPALAGGVALTTVTDVIGIIAFLGLATLLLL